jgi:hypothetical protein
MADSCFSGLVFLRRHRERFKCRFMCLFLFNLVVFECKVLMGAFVRQGGRALYMACNLMFGLLLK